MNKNGIDDLLEMVGPELVTRYVARNFTAGSSLHAVNEEYKAVTQQKGMSFDDCLKLMLFSSVVGLLLYFYLWYMGVPVYVSAIAMVALVLPVELYLLFPVRWKFENDRETRYRCEPILRDFKQAVEELDPSAEMADFGYTNSNIKMWLVGHALRLINAEKQSLEARFDKSVSAEYAFQFYSFEVNSRESFKKALTAAEKFGLTFNNPDLFREAEKYIAQTE